MALVRATCTECDEDVEMQSPSITLRAQRDLVAGTYEYICPKCGQFSVKAADKKVVGALYGVGCVEVMYDPPVIDLIDDTSPIDVDERIDLIREMQDPDLFDKALRDLLG